MLPPVYLFGCIVLCVAAHFLAPIAKVIPSPINYAGILLMAAGAAINLWTDSLFKREDTTVKPNEKPTALITYGPFGLSRHPMYLGMALILFGLAMLLGTLAPFILPVLFIAAMEAKFIPLEERCMEDVFGEEYLDYKERVRRWI